MHVFARNVQSSIRHEIGDAIFCLIVDETRDESRREQMALVIRFVDRSGFIRERFLDIVHVKDTTVLTLKEEISLFYLITILMFKILKVKGMMVLVICMESGMVCKLYSKHYVHCLAHQLQLALIVATREISYVHTFF